MIYWDLWGTHRRHTYYHPYSWRGRPYNIGPRTLSICNFFPNMDWDEDDKLYHENKEEYLEQIRIELTRNQVAAEERKRKGILLLSKKSQKPTIGSKRSNDLIATIGFDKVNYSEDIKRKYCDTQENTSWEYSHNFRPRSLIEF